jgi:Leucine-rich repeat (LRR) protein
LTELDLTELTALKFIELLYCQNLATLALGTHPVLERICVEDCNLGAIDLSGCPALADLRSASNNYTSINWGTTGAALWHICVRSNPGLTANLPDLTQFPLLRELLTWEDNQTGPFVCHSSNILKIDSYDNHYTSLDVSGCTSLMELNLSGNQLASVELGTAISLRDLTLKGCGLTESQVDYILQTLDASGVSYGVLDLNDNAAPSAAGLVHNNNLIAKNWTTIINTTTDIDDHVWNNEPIKVIVTSSEVRMLLNKDFVSCKADLYNFNGDLLLNSFVDSETLVFDVSSFSPGMYIVVLSKGEKKRVIKVIKP